MRLSFVISGFFALFSFAHTLCHAETVSTMVPAQFEAQVQSTLNVFLNQVKTHTFSEKSNLFLSPTSKEAVDAYLSDLYSAKGLLPGSRIRCSKIREWSLSSLDLDYKHERATAKVALSCINGDKGFISHKHFNFQKKNGSWFLSLKRQA